MNLIHNLRHGGHVFNFKRKLWHLTGMTIPAIYYFNLLDFIGDRGTKYYGTVILAICFGLTFLFDVMRLTIPSFSVIFMKSFGAIMKEEERGRFNGTVPFLGANLIILMFFPPEILFISCIYLLLGDTMAAFMGYHFGRYRLYNEKSLVGFLAGLTTNLVLGGLFLYAHSQSIGQPFVFKAILISGFIASFLELITGTWLFGLLDDNLIIPLSAALVLNQTLVQFV